MIKYFCDICGEEIREEYVETIESKLFSQFRQDPDVRTVALHVHNKCLRKMMAYLSEEGKK